MSNLKTTNQDYNTEQTSLPLQLSEETAVPKTGHASPPFIPYNNKQGISLFDIQDTISTKHVSRVIDEMIELIDDQVFFLITKVEVVALSIPK